MKTLIFLYGYNNYYNRKLKYSNDLDEYLDNYETIIKDQVNFNPNDGVNTSLVANLSDGGADYLLVVNEDGTIASRWFIMECRRNLNGQYAVQLKRDVIADYFKEIADAPVFVQKGIINDIDNPLLYNSEGMLFNQIKKSEHLLKDETETDWIVGYVAKEGITTDKVITVIDRNPTTNIESLDIQFNDPSNPAAGAKINYVNKISYFTGAYNRWQRELEDGYQQMDLWLSANYENNQWIEASWLEKSIGKNWKITSMSTITVENPSTAVPRQQLADLWENSVRSNMLSVSLGLEEHLQSVNRKAVSEEDYKAIYDLNGRIVYSASKDEFYRLTLGSTITNEYTDKLHNTTGSKDLTLFYALDSAASKTVNSINQTNPEYNFIKVDPKDEAYTIRYNMSSIEIYLEKVSAPSQIGVTIKPGFQRLNDAPYGMFVLKNNEQNLNLAQRIAEELGDNLYDLQIVPYFPCRERLTTEGIDIDYQDVNVLFNEIKSGEEVVDYLYWAINSQTSFIIPYQIGANYGNTFEAKIANETNLYRIVSPNYNGAFEFSPTKNNGVDFFNVNLTYKPFTPFIHVAPNFKGLYGDDFNDCRGLICNGNFSVSRVGDAWINYEIQNKNFQNIFNTQISTMDKTHKWETASNIVGAGVGAISTGISTGLITANPYIGIGAGAVSAVAGAVDVVAGESLYQTNRQSQKDMFNYNLQNIAARPDTLINVSSFNIINKKFPFIEYYTCSDIEKEALRKKIKYEGMTIMTIGKINDYIENSIDGYNYFKGQLIQALDVVDDFHIVDAIGVELEKGIYLESEVKD